MFRFRRKGTVLVISHSGPESTVLKSHRSLEEVLIAAAPTTTSEHPDWAMPFLVNVFVERHVGYRKT